MASNVIITFFAPTSKYDYYEYYTHSGSSRLQEHSFHVRERAAFQIQSSFQNE